MITPPDGRQPARPSGRPEAARPADGATLAPRERARLDEAVVTVARRGRGPAIAAALVAGAFLLGLVRPWDWLGGDPGTTAAGPAAVTGLPGDAAAPASSPPDGAAAGPPGAGAAGYQAPTCAYPASWRTASIQAWAGRQARVWTAAEAVTASGPADVTIPFHPIASDAVEAIGWCAPVAGPDRPPASAAGTLYRIRDGTAATVPVRRLEPAAPSALGELWIPEPGADGRPARWPEGRYVVRLATPSGDYVRYLGLEVGVVARAGTPSAGPSPGPSAGSSGVVTGSPAGTGEATGQP